MKFGINTFLFTSPFKSDSISLFPTFKKWGFDSVEIALEDASHIDPKLVKKALDENGLTCGSICAAMGPGRDLRGTPEEQNTAAQYICEVIDIMPVLGCPILVGPLYSSVGRAEPVSEEDYQTQWDTVVNNLKKLTMYAEQTGVKLAIEPLNRYETDFINTAERALEMIAAVNSDALMLHLDSFHMNIEEKDLSKAIISAGDKLGHFHACGSDRGTPGGDHTDWSKISAALNQIGYDKQVVIESFTTDVKIIAKAASIWRKIEPSQEDIAIKGLDFLKRVL
ncbi:sugar phosphate isomerase/epimerase [Mucilaginibacter sp. UR6-11]|uniref:sugar phosphate isomerase/epimerase family protein n=1 Tax=Mucilaginibacter sp. UR6-11 TaxID=1435644 RepID=UPI001E5A68B0|nr:sugar phosphate isomerase/epimerase family protein [Mucilaginibacter sp. UR6-11]MCC8426865.1 sugar phosphate isomerase/epimerase [Mucilaginibacter sp. UR6-11]